MVLFENTVPAPIPLVDGADPVTTGTPVDATFYAALKASLNKQLSSASDPTKYPSDAIAELATARGNFSSLALLLANVVTPNGAPVGAVIPSMLRNGLVLGNLLANDTFMMWSRGDSAAPDYWVKTGTGATVERCGVGQIDTTVLANQAHYSAKLTFGTTEARLTQYVLPVADLVGAAAGSRYAPVDNNGTEVSGYNADDSAMAVYGIFHVWCAASAAARIFCDSGLGVSYSPYHPGDSSWHTLIVAGSYGNTLSFGLSLGAGVAYAQLGCLIAVPVTIPPMYVPAFVVRDKYTVRVLGNPAGGTIDFMMPDSPIHILGAQMACMTAPTGTVPTIDLLTPIGGAYASMFVTLPTIAATKLVGTFQACDPAAGNYRRRTIRGLPAAASAALQDNSIMKMVYVDDGGNTLQDLVVTVHYLRYARPFEQFRSMGDIGEAA